MDDLLQHNQLSVEQMVNCHTDALAAESLARGGLAQRFIRRHLNFKYSRLLMKGFIVTLFPKNALTQNGGARVVK
jgi:hypothetical protein